MPDTKPLSNAEVERRLRAALDALGDDVLGIPRRASIGNATILIARSMLSRFLSNFKLRTMPTVDRWPAPGQRPRPGAESPPMSPLD